MPPQMLLSVKTALKEKTFHFYEKILLSVLCKLNYTINRRAEKALKKFPQKFC